MKKTDKRIIIAVAHDGGFSSTKYIGATPERFDTPIIGRFPSIYTPHVISGVTGVRQVTAPVAGIVGDDAALLAPESVVSDLTEDNYADESYHLFLAASLIDVIVGCKIPNGATVDVYLSLGINVKHEPLWGDRIRQMFEGSDTIDYESALWSGKIRFASVALKTQPQWVAFDSRVKYHGGKMSLTPTKGAMAIIDCGSNTFQGGVLVNDFTLRAPFCETVGSWEVIRNGFYAILAQKAAAANVRLGDVRMESLMTAYETREFRIGKVTIPLHDEIDALVVDKVAQRVHIFKNAIKTPALSEIILSGGDAAVNLEAIKAEYNKYVSGEIRIATDDTGESETLYRVASGGYKDAVRRCLKEGVNA